MENKTRKNIISNIIKWVIILVALVVVYIWKKEEIHAAFTEMSSFPFYVLLLCLLATLLHFATEGKIISDMTMYESRKMTWWEGTKCGLYCAFYKMISLGSLSGIAEIYYISKHEIEPGRASGIVLVQYVYQKLAITILGVLSFVALALVGIESVLDYFKWIVLGSAVALLIVIALTLISTSKKLAGLACFLIKKTLGKKFPNKAESLEKQILEFNEAGLYFWQHKILCLRVTLLIMLKMTLWYSITAIIIKASYPETLFIEGIALMAVSNMVGTVMIAPAGVGTLEFITSILIAPLFGNTAATVVILYRFFTMVIPFLIGSVVFALTKNSKDK